MVIKLEHEQAKAFIEQAIHPDLEELARRDATLKKMAEECPIRIEGTTIIAKIPDTDIAAILRQGKGEG